mmetsp:Transcript_45207/g.129668  ORF Transcript_45207/g.129668 Transcript_45207/m.129668 type:complete len:255 (+) Transcript_45207:240-1004(+)
MIQLLAAESNMLAAISRSPPACWSAITASRLAKPIMTKVLTPPAAKPKQGRFLEVLASSLSSPLDTTSTILPPPSERLPVLVLSIGSSFTTPPAAEVQGAGAAATRRAMPEGTAEDAAEDAAEDDEDDDEDNGLKRARRLAAERRRGGGRSEAPLGPSSSSTAAVVVVAALPSMLPASVSSSSSAGAGAGGAAAVVNDPVFSEKVGFEKGLSPAEAFMRLQERKRKGRAAEFGGPPRGCSPWRDGKRGITYDRD